MQNFRPRKKLKYVSYSRRLLVAMLAITIVVAAVIGGMLCELAMRMIQNMETTLTQKNMQIVGENLSGGLTSVEDYSAEVIASEAMNAAIKAGEDKNGKLESYLRRRTETVGNSSSLKMKFLNVYLENGVSCEQNSNLPYSDYESCVAYLLENGYVTEERYTPLTWVESVDIRDISGKMVNTCVWIRFLYDGVSMDKIGLVVGGLEASAFKNIFGVFDHAYFYQANGNLLSYKGEGVLQEGFPEELEQQIQSEGSKIKTVSWENEEADMQVCYWKDSYYSLYLLVPGGESQEEISALRALYIKASIFIILAGVAIGTIVNYFLSKNLSRSILSLKDVVQQVYEGDLEARYVPDTNDEVAYLGRHVNDMLDSIEEFYEAQERDELAKKDLEIQLLQSQINPHLLYNTFNSVALAVRNKESEKAEEMLFTLSDFLRASLSKGNMLVPLRVELEAVKKYIRIQQLAGHKDIRLMLDVPKELEELLVIRTTLQPIVENAVIHGLSGYRDDGEICITARLLGVPECLVILVRDNGIGIEPEELAELNESINRKNYSMMRKNYGMYNVNWRLKYKWNSEAYGISVMSEVSEFTEVKIVMPKA